MSSCPLNQVAPLHKKDNSFSAFNKYQLREQLGIIQFIQESDLEEFKKDGNDVQHLQPTPTPKSLMMVTQLQEFRRILIMANMTMTLFYLDDFSKDPQILWFATYILCAIPTYTLILYSYLPGK